MRAILIVIIGTLILIAGATGAAPNNCVLVEKDSVHAYYEPAFETALVGWFVERVELELVRTEGTWGLVNGQGIDTQLRHTRMVGWVQMSGMKSCPAK